MHRLYENIMQDLILVPWGGGVMESIPHKYGGPTIFWSGSDYYMSEYFCKILLRFNTNLR